MEFANFYGVNTPSVADFSYQCAVFEGGWRGMLTTGMSWLQPSAVFTQKLPRSALCGSAEGRAIAFPAFLLPHFMSICTVLDAG